MPVLLLGSRPAAGVDHAPIWIDGNANFTTANGVVGGTGTAGDPYLIAGWGFAISPWGRAIYIANTDAYVMIRGVTVSTTGTGGESYGVYLWNTTHVRVEDSAFVGLLHGVELRLTRDVAIEGNRFAANRLGVGTSYPYAVSGWDIRVEGNAFFDGDGGIGVSAELGRVHGNALGGGSIVVGGEDVLVSNNVLGGTIHIRGRNLAVLNNSITGDGTGGGITFGDQAYTGGIRIEGNTISDKIMGISAWYPTDVLVHGNVIRRHRDYGIYFEAVNNVTVSDNLVAANGNGVYLYFWSSREGHVSGNRFVGNGVGLWNGAGLLTFHNHFVSNVVHAAGGLPGGWDDGYPSGGNCWSDYTGGDRYSGPRQDQPGSDGIGDVAYDIPTLGQLPIEDRYPLHHGCEFVGEIERGPGRFVVRKNSVPVIGIMGHPVPPTDTIGSTALRTSPVPAAPPAWIGHPPSGRNADVRVGPGRSIGMKSGPLFC